MTGVFTNQGVTYEDPPRMEIIDDLLLPSSYEYKKPLPNHYYFFELNNDINIDSLKHPETMFDLNKNQQYFLSKALNQLHLTIEKDATLLNNEGITLPNEKVIDFACQLIKDLASKNIFPNNIATSAEEGLCLIYTKSNKSLYFELYNDGDLGYIIEDSKNKLVIENEDVNSLSEVEDTIFSFYC